MSRALMKVGMSTAMESTAKVMFSVYRDAGGDSAFDVIYYTELEEHDRDARIARVMAGETLHDGFLAESALVDGKEAVSAILTRLNQGETMDASEISMILAPFEA